MNTLGPTMLIGAAIFVAWLALTKRLDAVGAAIGGGSAQVVAANDNSPQAIADAATQAALQYAGGYGTTTTIGGQTVVVPSTTGTA